MLWNKEPTVIVNGLSGLLQQVLPLMVVVGLLHLSSEKLAGWVAVIGLVLTFVSTTLLRQQTVSTTVADKQIEIAKAATIDTPNEQIIQRAKDEAK